MSILLRISLVLALTLGILAPRASAIAMELMPDTFQTVIICSGTSMELITVDETGAPVKLAELDTPKCVMTSAIPSVDSPSPHWQTIDYAYLVRTGLTDQTMLPSLAEMPPASQGPPLLT